MSAMSFFARAAATEKERPPAPPAANERLVATVLVVDVAWSVAVSLIAPLVVVVSVEPPLA